MSNHGRVCPKCGYQRQPNDDLIPDYKCPGCGIVYNKSQPPEKTLPPFANAGDGLASLPGSEAVTVLGGSGSQVTETVGEIDVLGLRPARPLRCTRAGIYTGCLMIPYFVPLKLLFYLQFRIGYPADNINLFEALTLMQMVRTWEATYYLSLLLFINYAFFLRPMFRGVTWGQEKFGLALCTRDNPERTLTRKHHLLRFTGNIFVVLT